MGLQIGEIVPRRSIEFSDLKGKTVAIDAFNAIYQFLSGIRQPDGTPLLDNRGRVTSHLSGIFYRNISLMSEGIKLIYVFDGEYHELKTKTKEQRSLAKENAREKYEAAKQEEDLEGMAKYARSLSSITPEMLKEAKELLKAMGIAVYQAPGEGEMQCAELVKMGQAYAVGSQDYDALVVGAPRLIQNLTLARKRRLPNGEQVFISPDLIEYNAVLSELALDKDQLICLAILVGTDFNPGGIKGMGPKKSLPLVRQKKFPVYIFKEFEERAGFNWQDVFHIFKEPNVTREQVVFPKMDKEKIFDLLVKEHDFSKERVEKQLQKLVEAKGKQAQRTLF